MGQAVDFLLMLVVLLALATLATGRLNTCTRIVAAQGITVGVLLIVTDLENVTARLAALAALSIALKGLVFPWLIFKSMRRAGVQREIEPYIGFTLSLVLGAVALGVAFSLSSLLPLPHETDSRLLVPASLATVFVGLLLLVTRRKAVTQVLGYLVLENGIFVFSLALVTDLPALVETGVLLDLFVAVFVMGITIYQISREFDHIDADRLRQLRDLEGSRWRWPFGAVHQNGSSED